MSADHGSGRAASGGNAGHVAGAMLTGGRSSRMGRDKAFVEVDGIEMVVRINATMSAAGVDPIVAIGGDHVRLGRAGIGTVPDRWPGEGPLGAIITALMWSPHPSVFIGACDLARLGAATIGQLVAADDGAADVDVVLARTGRIEPLCGIWRCSSTTIDIMRGAFDTGERAVRRVLERLRVQTVDVDPSELSNFNTPEDLR